MDGQGALTTLALSATEVDEVDEVGGIGAVTMVHRLVGEGEEAVEEHEGDQMRTTDISTREEVNECSSGWKRTLQRRTRMNLFSDVGKKAPKEQDAEHQRGGAFSDEIYFSDD